jgi:hypothetical protein
MDLPCEDPSAVPLEYAALAGINEPVVAAGHSLGGLTIGGVSALRLASHTVDLCTLVPVSGKSWDQTHLNEPAMDAGFGDDHFEPIEGGGTLVNARGAAEFLYNTCPRDVLQHALPRLRPQRYAKDLAHATWVDIEGDHSPMLGRTEELAEVLVTVQD